MHVIDMQHGRHAHDTISSSIQNQLDFNHVYLEDLQSIGDYSRNSHILRKADKVKIQGICQVTLHTANA